MNPWAANAAQKRMPALLSFLLAQVAVPLPPSEMGIAMEGYPYPYPVRYLDTANGRMAYMDVPPKGPANGGTVFLLHGKNFFGAYWKGPAERLAASGYRVVIPDRIGFGKSAKPLIDYTFDLFAANDVALARKLGLTRFAVVGHSMGGMEAMRLARAYPAMVERLVLEDPIGLEDYGLFVPYRTVAQRTQSELDQTDDAYRSYVSAYYVRKDPGLVEPFVAIRAALRRSPEFSRWAEVAARTTNTILQQPTVYDLPRIACPTLFIIGEKDRTAVGKAETSVPLGNVPMLARQAIESMPHARLNLILDVGHIPHLEAPQAFERTLLGFLAERASI